MIKRNVLGRRRSDWIVPAVLAAIAGITIGWALTSVQKNREIEAREKIYRHALQLANRDIEAREQAAVRKPAPRPSPVAP